MAVSVYFSICFLVLAGCNAEVFISQAPDYLKFQETQHSLDVTSFPDVIKSLLGFTSLNEYKWDGLQTGSAFQRPKANVLITIEGLADGAEQIPFKYQHKYSTDTVKGSSFDMEEVSRVVQNTFPESLVVDKEHLEEFVKAQKADVTLKTLNMENTVDKTFVEEIQQLNSMSYLLEHQRGLTHDNSPDLFNFHLSSYRHIVNKYGDASPQAVEARSMLGKTIDYITKVFSGEYENSVVIEVLTLPGEDLVFKARKGRSLQAVAEKDPIGDKINLATDYDENFPAIFNIILWTMLLLAIALFGISYGMWNMDNGKDSIYMMTTPRLKKE